MPPLPALSLTHIHTHRGACRRAGGTAHKKRAPKTSCVCARVRVCVRVCVHVCVRVCCGFGRVRPCEVVLQTFVSAYLLKNPGHLSGQVGQVGQVLGVELTYHILTLNSEHVTRNRPAT